jgi:hypothetical protein
MSHPDLADRIQLALQADRATRPDLYQPSPGQLPSHVDHRVAQVVATALRDVPRYRMPQLDDHLTYEYQCTTVEEQHEMVAKLLEAGTCFAVIGGDLKVRFHDRGAKALGMEIPE